MGNKKLIITSVAAAAVAGYLMWGPDDGLPDTPERTADGSEIYEFDNVGEMAATSALVVKATVAKVEVGEKTGDPGEEITNRNVYLEISEVLFQGDGQKPGDQIVITEGFWDTAGVGVVMDSLQWTSPGDSGYYFLSDSDDDKNYGFISSIYGRVMIDNGAVEMTASDGLDLEQDGPWAGSKADFDDVEGLEDIINEATAAAETGEAKPVKPLSES